METKTELKAQLAAMTAERDELQRRLDTIGDLAAKLRTLAAAGRITLQEALKNQS